MWRASAGLEKGAELVPDEVDVRGLGVERSPCRSPIVTIRLQVRENSCGRHGLNGLTQPTAGSPGYGALSSRSFVMWSASERPAALHDVRHVVVVLVVGAVANAVAVGVRIVQARAAVGQR